MRVAQIFKMWLKLCVLPTRGQGATGEAEKVFDAKKRMICVVKLDWAEKEEGCSSRIFFRWNNRLGLESRGAWVEG